jgi:hypothetical protein
MVSNDKIALGIADLAINTAESLGADAERRVLIAQAKAGMQQASIEAGRVRLKSGTPQQLLANLVPPTLRVAVKQATPGMVPVEVSESLAPILMGMTAAEQDELAATLGQLPQANQKFVPTGGGKKSDLDGMQTKSTQPGSLGSILDGASAYIQSAGNGWPIRERE